MKAMTQTLKSCSDGIWEVGLESLLSAISDSNIAGIDQELVDGTYINDKSDEGCAPLFYAVLLGNLAVVEHLLNKGADPNSIADEPGAVTMAATPLELALQLRHLRNYTTYNPIVDILIKNGAQGT
jgi:hypothetical protein